MSTLLIPEEYEIIWFASMEMEVEIALNSLDYPHEGEFPSSAQLKGVTLLAGRMRERNVVIAASCWPRGGFKNTFGPKIVTDVTSHIRKVFPNLLFGLIVGIVTDVAYLTRGFSQDVRQGDVLVGLLEGEFDENIAYGLSQDAVDTPRWIDEREFINTAVQRAINNIQTSTPEGMSNVFHSYRDQIATRYANGTYADPGQDNDILYRTNADGTEELVKRNQRDKWSRTQVWQGPIDTVKYFATKDAQFWRRRSSLKDTGSSLPVCVIRGICDYGDGHENSRWRPYASAVAAAYAKTVLEKIHPHDLEISVPATGFKREITKGAGDLRPRQVAHQASQPSALEVIEVRTAADQIKKQDQAVPKDQRTTQATFRFRLFHRSTLIVVVIVFALLGGVMITLAVNQTRDSKCSPSIDTLGTDDGFWTMLGQMCLLVLTIYCTLYPVLIRDQRPETFIDKFWFFGLLLTSFAAAMGAIIAYPYSWKAAIILSSISSLAQAVSVAQLANSLESTTYRGYLSRRTLKME